MPEPPLTTPVALLIFNRPDTTAQVFAAIRAARPRQLLIVADGPRPDRAGETERCAAARAVVEQVDWPCEVLRNYADVNLGCRRRVSSGVDWVFQTAAEAILLEDDCVPHPSFFRFCAELLERYRDDARVMHIGGANFQPPQFTLAASYYFSRYPHVWGWASWRRAWQHYDVSLADWADPATRAERLQLFAAARERRFWRQVWDEVAAGRIDTWDYQWAYACLARGGLAVVPRHNLVRNIGFGADATHTRAAGPVANLPAPGLTFPLTHPAAVAPERRADQHVQQRFFSAPGMLARLSRVLARLGAAWAPARPGKEAG